MFFHQRNVMQTRLFEADSLDTVISMALTHEIESYLGRDELLEFCRRVFTMLRPGGVWINYDVVGPDGREEPVLADLTSDDGAADGDLAGLSTRARFERFAVDFRREEGDGITYQEVRRDGRNLVKLTRGRCTSSSRRRTTSTPGTRRRTRRSASSPRRVGGAAGGQRLRDDPRHPSHPKPVADREPVRPGRPRLHRGRRGRPRRRRMVVDQRAPRRGEAGTLSPGTRVVPTAVRPGAGHGKLPHREAL
ncbi:hypothetical protein G7085_07555 [Tessaracoccus sp. HDW20]|uniref:hypothetical protein n=1 Tax=Tessaracoccus coleopterorum TaxID=2714950 RepID=UPI0018D4870A|nr:hypothetical protein [Tessaracoccus coleopterorum]NHB84508.1 hypothetical protein [Tessaracoccus coleopterorum]